MYFDGVGFWAFIGTFYLVFMTWQDMKKNKDHSKNMMIDDRKNFFMMGVTLSLISHIDRSIWYILLLVLLVIILGMFLKKINSIGEADINALIWIMYGLSIINVFVLLYFFMIFGFLGLIYALSKKYIFKKKYPTPFFWVISLSFILNAVLFGLY